MTNERSSTDYATAGSKRGLLLNIGRSPVGVRLCGELLKARCHFRERHWLCGEERCPLCRCGSPVRVSWFGWFQRDDGVKGLVRISNSQWTQHFANVRIGDKFAVLHKPGTGLCWQSMPSENRLCLSAPAIAIKREVLAIHGIELEDLANATKEQIRIAICQKAEEACS